MFFQNGEETCTSLRPLRSKQRTVTDLSSSTLNYVFFKIDLHQTKLTILIQTILSLFVLIKSSPFDVNHISLRAVSSRDNHPLRSILIVNSSSITTFSLKAQPRFQFFPSKNKIERDWERVEVWMTIQTPDYHKKVSTKIRNQTFWNLFWHYHYAYRIHIQACTTSFLRTMNTFHWKP